MRYAGYDDASAAVALTITDDEDNALELNKTALTVAEGGTGSYTVKLKSEPTSTVTVTVSSADTGAVQLSKDAGSNYANSVTLTFTSSTWSTAQTVTVKAQSDADGNDESVQITNTAGSNYDDASASVTVTVTEEEKQITLSKTEVTLNEVDNENTEGDERQAQWTVQLSSAPTADVKVTVSSPDAEAVQVKKDGGSFGSSIELTFTTSSWNSAQTVTVQAQDDADPMGETITLTHVADGEYAGVSAEVTVMVVDDDCTSPPCFHHPSFDVKVSADDGTLQLQWSQPKPRL